MIEKFFNFNKINSLILVSLILSDLRYFKLDYDFLIYYNSNIIRLIGELSLIFLILSTCVYLIKHEKKSLINLLYLILIWVGISLVLNYDSIDLSYIKKSFQIFLCFFIFLVFSKSQNKLNFELFENLTIALITSVVIFSLAVPLNISPTDFAFGRGWGRSMSYDNDIYFFYAFLFCILLGFVFNKKVFYFSSIFFFLVLIFYLNFFLELNWDVLDIEAFVRKNNISWTILLIFFANLVLREKKNNSFNFFILLFTFIFCAKYAFLAQILLYGIVFISKKNIKILNFVFFLSIFLTIIYLVIVSSFTGFYIDVLNNAVNNLFKIKNLGTVTSFDGLTERTYEISQISPRMNSYFSQIYVGLIHRALLAEVYLRHILNNQIIGDNFLINIRYHSFVLNEVDLQDLKIFSKFSSEFLNNFTHYSRMCGKLFYLTSDRTYECAAKLGFLPLIYEYNEYHGMNQLEVKHKIISLFQSDFWTNQNFNSSHNQFLDFPSKFGLIGFFLFLFLFFKIREILLNDFNTNSFKIILIVIFLLLNFDNYLFYNYFNVSYLVWMLLGLSINKNYIKHST